MLGRLLQSLFGRNKTAPATAVAAGRLDAPAADAQKVLRLDDVNCLVRARHGWFIANRYDQYLGRALIRYGEYGEIEQAFLCSLLAPGDCAIEVGANIGAHSVGLAKHLGAEGRLVAVEAQPAIFRVLSANVVLNALTNVVLHQCGCADRHGTMVAPEIDYTAAQLHNSGGVSLLAAGAGAVVPVLPLDELAGAAVAERRLRLIKIDVEGMEREVLQGAQNLIARHRPLLYVENDRVGKSRQLIEALKALDYRLWWHATPLFNPRNHFGVTENDYPHIVSMNMVCQPQERGEGLPPSDCSLREIVDVDVHPFVRAPDAPRPSDQGEPRTSG